MVDYGYALSSEEHAPLDLVRNAVRAEQAGFSFVSISDHFHPWLDAQGNSPFVWSVIGGIATSTEWSVGPNADVVKSFEHAGGSGPRIAQLTFCYAADADDALHTVQRVWPVTALKRPLNQELPLPQHFEEAAQMVREDDIREALPLGPDPEAVLRKVREFEAAGYDHIYLHQIGPDQDGFFTFWERELRPQLG